MKSVGLAPAEHVRRRTAAIHAGRRRSVLRYAARRLSEVRNRFEPGDEASVRARRERAYEIAAVSRAGKLILVNDPGCFYALFYNNEEQE
jgi:hypothetical protein